jgi:hypothetical protein
MPFKVIMTAISCLSQALEAGTPESIGVDRVDPWYHFPSEIAMLTFMGSYYDGFPACSAQRSSSSRCGVKESAGTPYFRSKRVF